MKSYIRIIGNSTPEGVPSIVVHFDSKKYMFNCSEGTQRMCIENKTKLPKMGNIFLTRVDWDCVGGIPGMLMSLADQGTKNVKLLGGKNLTHFMAATRHFIYRTSMSVETHEFDHDGAEFKDENLTIRSVILLPDDYKPPSPPPITIDPNSATLAGTKRDHDSMSEGDAHPDSLSPVAQMNYKRQILSDMFSNQAAAPVKVDEIERAAAAYTGGHPLAPLEKVPGADVRILEPTGEEGGEAILEVHGKGGGKAPAKKFVMRGPKKLPRSKPVPQVISYVCQGPAYPGKFDPKAALTLGLKPGKEYGRLQQGNSVTLPDGTVIHPHQVMGSSRPGAIFIIIDCPTPAYIPSLLASPAFAIHQTDDVKQQPKVVIHMLGKGVIEDEKYREWMKKFGGETQHIVGSEDYCAQSILFTSHAIAQLKLSRLDDRIFPIPQYNNIPLKLLESLPNLPRNTTPLSNLLQFQLEPSPVLSHPEQQSLFDHHNPKSKAVEILEELHEYKALAIDVRAEVAKIAATVAQREKRPGDDVVITTLGTGSAIPSKYRNVSATLLEIPDHGNVLLDAGEGTFGQMLRLMGVEGVEACLLDLRLLFVSHLHADHHLGAVKVLGRWNRGSAERDSARRSASNVRDVVKGVCGCGELWDEEGEVRGYVAQLKKFLGLTTLKTVDVIHCRWAYGISLEHASGWKIVYSGDTRPSEKLVKVGLDATVLIHEATFEDDMTQEALTKGHCTTREAVEVGMRMNASSTLLTHFSQRYPKIPVFTNATSSVGIAFDMMRVRVAELPRLPRFIRAMEVLYSVECDEANEND
ncbi:beta-lactamase-like protein [Jimgerdemannia flammicorona]|uniref:ribonuclease Z n=1 Tax=Jimgerdemannia flammicorona TaxID=994334 RepID=A0A433QJR4_9FUNG|nr:beta-lactamase-like protein [Jimgerdemannia flammicorona]